jgi:hypothetical protein
MRGTFSTRNITCGMAGNKCLIKKRRGRALIPEKMSENGPVVAEIS